MPDESAWREATATAAVGVASIFDTVGGFGAQFLHCWAERGVRVNCDVVLPG